MNQREQNVMDAAQRLSWEVGHHEIGACMCAKCDLHLQLEKLKECHHMYVDGTKAGEDGIVSLCLYCNELESVEKGQG